MDYLIYLLGVIGFFIANYIYQSKKKNKKVICPNKTKCDRVIHSSYSKIYNIPVEKIGRLYYLFIIIFYGAINFFGIYTKNVLFMLFIISTLALVFSLYLLFVELFILKKICFWCTISFIVSFLIFIMMYIKVY